MGEDPSQIVFPGRLCIESGSRKGVLKLSTYDFGANQSLGIYQSKAPLRGSDFEGVTRRLERERNRRKIGGSVNDENAAMEY